MKAWKTGTTGIVEENDWTHIIYELIVGNCPKGLNWRGGKLFKKRGVGHISHRMELRCINCNL